MVSMSLWKMESKFFYPIYMGKRMIQIRIGGVPLKIKLEWVVSAVLANLKGTYNILTVHQTETINWWGFGMEVLHRCLIGI